MLCVNFWVFLRRMVFNIRRFGTWYLVHVWTCLTHHKFLSSLISHPLAYEDGTDTVVRNVGYYIPLQTYMVQVCTCLPHHKFLSSPISHPLTYEDRTDTVSRNVGYYIPGAGMYLLPNHKFLSSFISHPLAYEDGTDSVPKRLLLNTIRRRTTQKVTHDI
jgi:hypothetical protein